MGVLSLKSINYFCWFSSFFTVESLSAAFGCYDFRFGFVDGFLFFERLRLRLPFSRFFIGKLSSSSFSLCLFSSSSLSDSLRSPKVSLLNLVSGFLTSSSSHCFDSTCLIGDVAYCLPSGSFLIDGISFGPLEALDTKDRRLLCFILFSRYFSVIIIDYAITAQDIYYVRHYKVCR